ncbi:MAG: hypothetical protein ACK4UP_02325 [Spirosomataceae bacterium]
MQSQQINHLVPKPLNLSSSKIEDELAEYRQKIAELEKQEERRKYQEVERQKKYRQQQKKEKAANALFETLEKMGIQLADQESKTDEPTVESTKISTQKGLFWLTGVFVFFFAFFALYGSFASLNDSEVRINNAAYIHFISHIWLAVSVILSGVAVQYLLFNMQARYFWSNIETQNSFVHDFQKPTYEGVVRMSVCLFTFAFPTFIIASIFQLILG